MVHNEEMYLSLDDNVSKRWSNMGICKVGATLIGGACLVLLATSQSTSAATSTNLFGMSTLSRPSSVASTVPSFGSPILAALPGAPAWKELAVAAIEANNRCEVGGLKPTPRFTAATAFFNLGGDSGTKLLKKKAPAKAAKKAPAKAAGGGGLFNFGSKPAATPKAKPAVKPRAPAPAPARATRAAPRPAPRRPAPTRKAGGESPGYKFSDVDERVGAFPPFGYWDPLGLATTISDGQLAYYREAELKHGRICMLASLGFVVGENYHPLFGGDIDGPGLQAFTQVQLSVFWPAVLALTGGIELLTGLGRAEGTDDLNLAPVLKADVTPGDIGFDPLRLKRGFVEKGDYVGIQNRELAHCRLAMIATLGMILQEIIVPEEKLYR